MFLTCNQVPVIHKPWFQLLWDFHFNLDTVYKSFLLSREDNQLLFTTHQRASCHQCCKHFQHLSFFQCTRIFINSNKQIKPMNLLALSTCLDLHFQRLGQLVLSSYVEGGLDPLLNSFLLLLQELHIQTCFNILLLF